MAFPEGNKLLAGDLRANLDETNADIVQFTKRWNWKGLPNTKDTFAECLQLQISVLHQSMCIFRAGLSSCLVSHMIAEQSMKKKYIMHQIPIKMLTQHAIPNSRLYNLKIYSSKGCISPTSQSPKKMNFNDKFRVA